MFCSVAFFDSSDSSSDEEKRKVKVYRRKLRDSSNPLELPEKILSKEAFLYVLEKLNLPSGKRSTFIPPTLKLAVTLELLGGASYQWLTGNDYLFPMGQSTVSTITSYVIRKIEEILCPIWIKFSIKEETKIFFMQQYSIPGVIGCLDGTHIMLLKPARNEYMFFNRKGRHSINTMIICDENLKIIGINAKYGGAAHDSFVWQQSMEYTYMENLWEQGQKNCYLLADSAYKLEPFVITPYKSPAFESAESYFNSIHSKARSKVECCIGVWKGRWRILLEERKSRSAPEKVAKIINTCAALHNICVNFRVPSLENGTEEYDADQHLQEHVNNNISRTTQAEQIRNRIRDNLFPNNS